MTKRKQFTGFFELRIIPAYNQPLSGHHPAQYSVAFVNRTDEGFETDLFRWDFNSRKAATGFYRRMPGEPVAVRDQRLWGDNHA